jgi:hypothetical protein
MRRLRLVLLLPLLPHRPLPPVIPLIPPLRPLRLLLLQMLLLLPPGLLLFLVALPRNRSPRCRCRRCRRCRQTSDHPCDRLLARFGEKYSFDLFFV